MRLLPLIAALLVGIAGLSVGTVAAPSPADATSSFAAHGQAPDEISNASIDRLVLANVSGTFTVEAVSVDRVVTDRGTVEDVTLEEATVTVENATVVASNLSTTAGGTGHVSLTIEDGSVTVEEATVTVNGQAFSVDDVSASVENGSATSDELGGLGSAEMTVEPAEARALLEGATVEDAAIRNVSADAGIDLVWVAAASLKDRTASALAGDVALESVENASVEADAAMVENGTLVLRNATVTVEAASGSVDVGIVELDDETVFLNEEEVVLDGPFTVERDEVRVPLW